jgi:hypothetical protein
MVSCLEAGVVAFLYMVWMKSIFIFEGVSAMLCWELCVPTNVHACCIVVVDVLHFCALDLTLLFQEVTVVCTLYCNSPKSNRQETDGHT